jgi:hypothetical protein
MPYVICLGIRQRKEHTSPEFLLTLLRLRDVEGLSDVAVDPSLLGYDGGSGQVILLFRRIVLPSNSWSSSQ